MFSKCNLSQVAIVEMNGKCFLRRPLLDITLIRIEGTTPYVEGLDAVNRSPVLDIKLKIGGIREKK
jgi:hypothetical protein